MPRHRYECAPYDHIADYAWSTVQTAIVAAEESRGDVTVELSGEAIVPLRLWVLADVDGTEHRYEVIAPFRGCATARFTPIARGR